MDRIKIQKGKSKGTIEWNKSLSVLKVNFPDKNITTKIYNFFQKPRIYYVPQSDKIDDYLEEKHTPMENETWFMGSLSDLEEELGVQLIK